MKLNPNADAPPPTDHGVVEPFWYSFDLTHRRVQEGGWTHQVTSRELPVSKDIAGVNMRLTKGSFRELHWHLADEWAIMLPGRQPDAQTVQKIKQRKPPAISYDDGKWVDPRRAAAYLEDKLPKRDRILVSTVATPQW